MAYGVVRNNMVMAGGGVTHDGVYGSVVMGRAGLGILAAARTPIVIATPKLPGSGGAWGPWMTYVTDKFAQAGTAARFQKAGVGALPLDVWIRRPYSRFDCGPVVNGPIRPARTGGSRIQSGASYRSSHYNVIVPAGEPPYYYVPAGDFVDVVHNLHIPVDGTMSRCVVEMFPTGNFDPIGCAAFVSDKNVLPLVYGAGNAIRIENVPGAPPHDGGIFDVVVHSLHSQEDVVDVTTQQQPRFEPDVARAAGPAHYGAGASYSYRSVHLNVTIPGSNNAIITHHLHTDAPGPDGINHMFVSLCPRANPVGTDVYVADADKRYAAGGFPADQTRIMNAGQTAWTGDVIIWRDISAEVGLHLEA